MTIYKLPECTPVSALPAGAALALGNFDGVHIGHQRLFDAAGEMKKEGICTCSAAWTFTLLSKPDSDCPHITDREAKLHYFAECGLDYAVFEDFQKICQLDCREFVSRCLLNELEAGGVVCGFNFRFGKGKAGDAKTLFSLLSEHNVPLRIIDAVKQNGIVVSSTEIRERILNGDTKGAADLLGHPFSISFPVVHGNQIGRTIGIPTINQSFPEGHIIPRRGIYACSCFVDGEIYLAVANVGVRPTVSESQSINCETHIINYRGDLYGRRIRVEFYEYLRDEMKFDSVESLRRQIRIDIAECLDYFATEYGD